MTDIVERLQYYTPYGPITDMQADALMKEAADEIERLRNLYKETCEEKNKEIFEWIEHSKQLVLNSLPWQEENARLRKALQDIAEDDEDYRYRGQEYRMIARAALEEKE